MTFHCRVDSEALAILLCNAIEGRNEGEIEYLMKLVTENKAEMTVRDLLKIHQKFNQKASEVWKDNKPFCDWLYARSTAIMVLLTE